MQDKYQKRILVTPVKHGRTRLMFMATLCGLVLLAPLVMAVHGAFADGDADYSLTPGSGTVAVGSQFTVTLSENSLASDNTNVADAFVTYDSNLQYVSVRQGPFGTCDIETPNSGEVDLSCVTNGPVSGMQTVATITFTALSAGSASISLDPGSDIEDDSGTNIWDGTIPVAAFTINAPGASGGGSGGVAAGSSSGASGSAGGAPSTGSGSPSPAGSSESKSSAEAGSAVLKLTVTDHTGKLLKGATVNIDNRHTVSTNSQGEAVFSGLAVGTHTVTVTKSGMAKSTTMVTLSANETKSVSIRLASQTSPADLVAYVCIGLTVLGLIAYFFNGKSGIRYSRRRIDTSMTPGIVVGSGLPASDETPTAAPTPAFTQGAVPGVIIPNAPENGTAAPTQQPAVVPPHRLLK